MFLSYEEGTHGERMEQVKDSAEKDEGATATAIGSLGVARAFSAVSQYP